MPIFAVLQAGKSRFGGQPIWFGDPVNPKPFTIQNITAAGNIWIGELQSVGPTTPNQSTPISPGGYLSFDGTRPIYYVIADAANVQAATYPGVISVFSTIAAAGGATGGTLGEDPSTPTPVHVDDVSGVAATGTSASFSPPASSLLVVIVNIGGSTTPNNTTVSDSGSHTWSRRCAIGFTGGLSAIYTTFLTAAPGSITVTVSTTDTTTSIQFAVRVLDNANSNQGSAATATNSGTGTQATGSITTTQQNSWVYCCTLEADQAAIAGTTTIDAFDTSLNTFNERIGRQSSPTSTPGPTTLGWNISASSSFTWAALEILHS